MQLDTNSKELNLLLPTDLSAEVERLKEEVVDERERNLRTLADSKNFRTRIERDGNKIAEESKRGMFFAMLEIADDLQSAINFAHEAKLPLEEGLLNIIAKFHSILAKYGVVTFECIGLPFDHDLHEAIAMATHEGSEPREVVDELRKGYLFNNQLLRPAQVRVSG
jgi:molecular chaperone GrpE